MSRDSTLDDFVADVKDIGVRSPKVAAITSAICLLLALVCRLVGYSTWPLLAQMAFWFLAIAFGIAALQGVIRNRTLDTRHSVEDLKKVDWRDFEYLVADMFRRRGYEVRDGRGFADGGVDVTLTHPNGQTVVVQCKLRTKARVGPAPVREFFGVMTDRGLPGIFVTTGHFSREALRFADGKNMELIDGPRLMEEVQKVQRKSSHSVSMNSQTSVKEPKVAVSQTPLCPICGESMVQRTAKRGDRAGQSFWGCSGYPKCRGTRAN